MDDKQLADAFAFLRGQITALEVLTGSVISTLSDQQRAVVCAHSELAIAGALNASIPEQYVKGFDATRERVLALNPEAAANRQKHP